MHIHSSGNSPASLDARHTQTSSDDSGGEVSSAENGGATHSVKVSLSSTSVRLSHADSVAEVAAPEPVQPATNQYAGAILTVLDGQLEIDSANGRNTEQLQTRLEAGLSGFLQGFDEAFTQLDAMPEFTNDIKAEVYETKTQVLAGLAAIAEELGLDNSTITSAQEAHAQDVATLESSEDVVAPAVLGRFSGASAFQASENTFSFELETADGDKVTILASTLEAMKVQQDRNEILAEKAERNAFSLEVEGELDEDELRAINDLLNQVNSASESFFSGNVEAAFQQALGMGFDSNEIKGFALQLTRTVSTQVKGAYEPTDSSQTPSRNLAETSGFYRELNATFEQADEYGLERQIVVQLMEAVVVTKGKDPETLHKILENTDVAALDEK